MTGQISIICSITCLSLQLLPPERKFLQSIQRSGSMRM